MKESDDVHAPVLYLHAGTHKTGTTAIQAFADAHRDDLLKRGLLYPGYFPFRLKAHHWFAHWLGEERSTRLKNLLVFAFSKRWLRQAVHRRLDVFISVEAFYRHAIGSGPYMKRRKHYLEKVSEALKGFQLIPILVFRRPDNYIRANYMERVMNAACPQKEFNKYLAARPKRLQYYKNALLFRDVLGGPRCLIYEDLVNSGRFFSEFFAAMGTDVSSLSDIGVVRKSPSAAETMVKNFANQYLRDRRESRAFVRWMRGPDVAERIRDAYGNREYDLWPSHEARREFLESREADLRKLREEFLPERTRLFPPLQKEETAPPVPELPDELKKLVLGYFKRVSE